MSALEAEALRLTSDKADLLEQVGKASQLARDAEARAAGGALGPGHSGGSRGDEVRLQVGLWARIT